MSHEGNIASVKSKLRKYFEKTSPEDCLFNPFEIKGDLQWFNKRFMEGYYGPLASLDRSAAIENRADTFIKQISGQRDEWKKKFEEGERRSILTIKDSEIESLKTKWQEIPKGGVEEEKWMTEALGFTTAYFERFQKQRKINMEIWDNQLLYTALMSLDKGEYSFGELTKLHRAIQLDTGEGKTICSGLITAIELLQGKEVIIVEQNYISAENHAEKLAPFFEDFLGVETGVVVDRFQGSKIVRDVKIDDKGLVTERQLPGKNLKKSFVFTNGKLAEQKGPSGRQRSWRKKIVYCDHNSLGSDIASDRQLTTKEEDVLVPDLSKKVGLIQEADSLVIDEAINPFQIQVPTSGMKAWNMVSQLFFTEAEISLEEHNVLLSTIPEPIRKTVPEIKKDINFTKDFFYFLWANLYQAIKNTDLTKDWLSKGAYLISQSQELKYSSSVLDSVIDNLTEHLSPMFNDDRRLTERFLRNNEFIVTTALNILMTSGPDKGFISGEKPVLMDQYGVPLDNRQKDVIHQVFLQLFNIWEREGLTEKIYTTEDVQDVLDKTYLKLEVPFKIANRIIPSVLYREFSELKLTSGSLIPVSQSIMDLYEAETLAVSRHEPIPESKMQNDRLYSVCLDGGVAEIDFIEKNNITKKIETIITTIQEEGQSGLIIMPDIESANMLYSSLSDKEHIIVITGSGEIAKRGSLEEIISNINPGDIIITTQMAHRDIDPVLSNQVKINGGLNTVVYNPPNERGLWQALQRSIRADTPGKRILLISEDSINDIKNQYLISPPPMQPLSAMIKGEKQLHPERQRSVDALFNQASTGNIKAQKKLFRSYVDYLRNKEFQTSQSIMFAMVRELPLKNFRERSLRYITEDNENLWSNYINLIAYAIAKRSYPAVKIPPKIVAEFLDIPDKKRREERLENVGLYSNMDFIATREKVKKSLSRSFWSAMLEAVDFQYRDFMTRQMGSDIQRHSYLQYQGAWRNFLEDFLTKQFNLKQYIRQKIEDLEI